MVLEFSLEFRANALSVDKEMSCTHVFVVTCKLNRCENHIVLISSTECTLARNDFKTK